MAGISGMPDAVDRFTLTAYGFSRVVENAPEQVRWQLELLLLEMEATGFLGKLYERMDRLQDWAETLTKTVDDLPSNAGAELERTIASAEKSQAEFRATLSEARKVAAETHEAILQVRQSLSDARELTPTVQEAAREITRTGQAWGEAATQVRGVLADWDAMGSDEEEVKDPNQPSGAAEYTEMAKQIQSAATEVRSLLADLRSPHAEKSDLQRTVSRAQSLMDRLFIWAIVLALTIFALSVIARRLRPPAGG